MKEKIKEYSNGEITVVWDSTKCFHAANCVRMLPEVYKPNDRPWIQVENGSTTDLKTQVKQCPSGALTYFMNNNIADRTGSGEPDVVALPNGPLLVYGELKVLDKDGTLMERFSKTAFCRCGQSMKKPYCDGSHMKNGFTDH